MTPAEVEALEQAIGNGVEAAFMHLLNDPSRLGRHHRIEAGEAIERAVRAGVDAAVDACLVNPFPRRGAARAVMGNARSRIRAAIHEELVSLLG
jgi:hypothetical protein